MSRLLKARNALRLALAGLSPRSDVVTPLVPDHRYRLAQAAYAFAGNFVNGKRVLEIGSGTGFGCAQLAAAGAAAVVGIEQHERPVRHARRRYGSGAVRFVHGSLRAPLEVDADPPFDVIVALQWLQRDRDVEAKLAEVRRLLADRGQLLTSVPLYHDRAGLEAAVAGDPAGTHLYPWYWQAILRSHVGAVRCFRQEVPPGTYIHWHDRSPSTLQPSDVRYTEVDGGAALARGSGLGALFVATATARR